MREERQCEFCGKSFIAKKSNGRYCSNECARKGYKERAKEYYREKKMEQERQAKGKLTVTEITKKARQAGMSYGKYVAQMERNKAEGKVKHE